MRARVRAYVYTYLPVRTCAHVRTCLHGSVRASVQACEYKRIVHTCVCIYVYECVCARVYVCPRAHARHRVRGQSSLFSKDVYF